MNRYAPKATRAEAPIALYCLRKDTHTIYVERIERVSFCGEFGDQVRYDRNWHRLHSADKFNEFLKECRTSTPYIVLYEPEMHHFDAGEYEAPLPFIVGWEPERMYY